MCGRQKKSEENKNEDAASPIVATESVFITAAVDAHEIRYVAIFDILGAYLRTETDEDAIMYLEGEIA